MNKTFKIPSFVRANITPDSYNETDHTIEVVFATEVEAKRRMWDGTKYTEQLLCTPESVRLERANAGANLVDTHATYTVNTIYGVVTRAWVENKECKATVRLSKRPEVSGIVGDIIDGIIRNISVGYDIHETMVTENEETNLISVRVSDWEPGELSVCSVPVDYGSGVRSKEDTNQPNLRYHEITITKNKRTMTEEENAAAAQQAGQRSAQPNPPAAAAPAVVVDDTALRSAAVTEERTRVSTITSAFRAANLTDNSVLDGMISRGITADAARIEIIAALEAGQAPAVRTQHISIGKESIEKKREAMENAIMNRANPSIPLKPEAREFRGMSLLDMAREAVEDAGGKTRGLSTMEIAQNALNIDGRRAAGMHSTSDFPNILGNTVNSSLAREYALQERTFVQWATRGTVKDFKEKSVISTGEFSNFEEVKEGGEYTYATIGEGAEKLRVVKYGKIISLTWESIINDDLGAFSRIPRAIANAAARKQSDIVYDILLNNPKMSDGVALFHATHGNLATGSALDITNIGLLRKLLRNQKGLDKKDFLNLMGKYLLVGPDNEEAALQYASSSFVPTEINKQNVWKGQFDPIVEPRITGNKWFLAADNAQIDTVEYAFLEGQPELFTEQRNGFDVDGVEIKARMVFGAKAVDFRGLAYNPGS
ncbi:MAG: hypothetical protein J7577_13330 [Sphingobacteriaceae bacterium]|nr:hypothetical protein [Sphingobacteriaceae bacterium]